MLKIPFPKQSHWTYILHLHLQFCKLYTIIFTASTSFLCFFVCLFCFVFLCHGFSVYGGMSSISFPLSFSPCYPQLWHCPGCSSVCIQRHTAAGRRGWARWSAEPVSQRRAPESHQAIGGKKTKNNFN